MSQPLQEHVYKTFRLNGIQTSIAAYLAFRTNERTGRCNPPHQTIADDLGWGVRTVKDNLLLMRYPVSDLDWITGRPNQYIWQRAAAALLTKLQSADGATQSAAHATQSAAHAKQSAGAAPQPKEPKRTSSTPPDSRDENSTEEPVGEDPDDPMAFDEEYDDGAGLNAALFRLGLAAGTVRRLRRAHRNDCLWANLEFTEDNSPDKPLAYFMTAVRRHLGLPEGFTADEWAVGFEKREYCFPGAQRDRNTGRI